VARLAQEVLQARAALVAAMELASHDLVASVGPLASLALRSPDEPGAGDELADDIEGASTTVSRSAVFEHAPSGSRGAGRRPRRRVGWQLAVSFALAALGIGLGVYAMMHGDARRSAPTAPPAVTGR
jgi:hypothetical protein